MITLRRNNERRHAQRGNQDNWLTFYSNGHKDPVGDGFGNLTAFNEMLLQAGETAAQVTGTGAEIVTYVYRGVLAQENSNGSSGVVHSGEFQYMTIGRGIRHKETNPSPTDRAHVFRMFLRPAESGLDSAHKQIHFPAAQRHNLLCVIASPDGRRKSLKILQDALIYSSILDSGHHLIHELLPGRSAWLHVISGEAALQEIILTQGDGVGVTSESSVSVTAQESSEILLVDLGPAPRPFAGRAGQ
jgi:redox-sensitive bicupin YhaK (pirin superfamily)